MGGRGCSRLKNSNFFFHGQRRALQLLIYSPGIGTTMGYIGDLQ